MRRFIAPAIAVCGTVALSGAGAQAARQPESGRVVTFEATLTLRVETDWERASFGPLEPSGCRAFSRIAAHRTLRLSSVKPTLVRLRFAGGRYALNLAVKRLAGTIVQTGSFVRSAATDPCMTDRTVCPSQHAVARGGALRVRERGDAENPVALIDRLRYAQTRELPFCGPTSVPALLEEIWRAEGSTRGARLCARCRRLEITGYNEIFVHGDGATQVGHVGEMVDWKLTLRRR
jgi:hypothetical protein